MARCCPEPPELQPPQEFGTPNDLVVLLASQLQHALQAQVRQMPAGYASGGLHEFANTLFKFTGLHLNNEKALAAGAPPGPDDEQVTDTLVKMIDILSLALSSVVTRFGDQMDEEERGIQARLYGQAQGLADTGDLKQAAVALDGFIKTYPASTLKPNAVFAAGLAYAGMGDKAKSSSLMQTFVKDYPDHPLVADAGKLMDALR